MGQKEMGKSSNKENCLCIKEKVLQGIKRQGVSYILICRNFTAARADENTGATHIQNKFLDKRKLNSDNCPPQKVCFSLWYKNLIIWITVGLHWTVAHVADKPWK